MTTSSWIALIELSKTVSLSSLMPSQPEAWMYYKSFVILSPIQIYASRMHMTLSRTINRIFHNLLLPYKILMINLQLFLMKQKIEFLRSIRTLISLRSTKNMQSHLTEESFKGLARISILSFRNMAEKSFSPMIERSILLLTVSSMMLLLSTCKIMTLDFLKTSLLL